VVAVPALNEGVTIGRDRYGIPYVHARNDADAWFGLGFAQGQDRAFQIELLQRVTRGTLAALIGPDGLTVDRFSRRIGFARAGAAALAKLDDTDRSIVSAFAAGVNAGREQGLSRRPHEYALLRAEPTPYEPADATGVLAVLGFLLSANWDSELARLKILELDGPAALEALDAGYPAWHPVTSPPGQEAGLPATGLLDDIARFESAFSVGGASNNWVLSGAMTASGKPLLANDTHLSPVLPPHFHLAHLTTPDWTIVGAALAATPLFASGHNGHVAWGVTAGLVDNTDLFIEEVGPDGTTVRNGDGFVACEVLTEPIEVRGEQAVIEHVLLTPRGPVIGPALDNVPAAISVSATWLTPVRAGMLGGASRAHTVAELVEAMANYHGPSLNVVAADSAGTIGWKLIGQAPIRNAGVGAVPQPGWNPEMGWEDDPLSFAEMPGSTDPDTGWLATANNRPDHRDARSLGIDWVEGYRIARIGHLLQTRNDWDVVSSLHAQLDTVTPVWEEMRPHLEGLRGRAEVASLLQVLEGWDGNLAAGSVPAAVFVLWLKRMLLRVAKAAAPNSWDYAAGRGVGPGPLNPHTLFGFVGTGRLTSLLNARPDGWFVSWDDEVAAALLEARGILRAEAGDDPQRWAWGHVRQLRLLHPFGSRRGLAGVFNVGPIPFGGDMSTVSQAGAIPLDPLGNPSGIAAFRIAIEVDDWDRARFSLPGGQSGNPLSPHYDDQVELWLTGVGANIPYSSAAVARAIERSLHLVPDPEMGNA
jgi:penicillin amidase